MALANLINLSSDSKKIGISEERIRKVMPALRQYFAYWREYPDMFIDFLQTGNEPDRKKQIEFYFYQRVFVRATMRYKYAYFVFPRA